jgi:hypothetical protein
MSGDSQYSSKILSLLEKLIDKEEIPLVELHNIFAQSPGYQRLLEALEENPLRGEPLSIDDILKVVAGDTE